MMRRRQKASNVFDALRGHACFEALDAIGDAVFTGNTGTNLCDLNINVCAEAADKAPQRACRRTGVHARQIIDCKCRPMVEVDVITEDGSIGTAAPTGSSVGMYPSRSSC